MKRTVKLFVTLLLLATINVNVFAQSDESPIVLKPFGIGLHMEQFNLSDIGQDFPIAPSNKIIFTYTPTNFIRIEPEIGYSYSKNKENDTKSTGIYLGIGAFGMYQKGKTNLYGGLRFEYGDMKSDYNDWQTDLVKTSQINRISIGPAVGAEYLFTPHFSIGGEVGLNFFNITGKDDTDSDEEEKYTYTNTTSGLFLRFYF